MKFGIQMAALFSTKARMRQNGLSRQHFSPFSQKTIWMHCASLGEFEQGRPVLEKLKLLYPSYPVVVSFFSPSGFEQQKNYPHADKVIYLPYDSPGEAKNIIQQINPALVLWIKYEYWINHLLLLNEKKIPVLLISGIFRDSQAFFKPYGQLWRKVLTCFSHLFVQNESSVQLLSGIGITKSVSVSGDTRYDRVMTIAKNRKPLETVSAFVNDARCIVAGSTWEADEQLLKAWIEKSPNVKLIIAPHLVNENNIQRICSLFPNAIRYSSLFSNTATCSHQAQVLIIDNIGLLSSLYAYGHIAYVGGGFSAGIHNTLEAAVYGIPVVFGPKFQKFEEAKSLIKKGAAFTCNNAAEGIELLTHLTVDDFARQQAGLNSGAWIEQNLGASDIVVGYICENRLLTN